MQALRVQITLLLLITNHDRMSEQHDILNYLNSREVELNIDEKGN